MAKRTRVAFFVILDLVCFNVSYLLASLITGLDFFASYLGGFLILIAVKMLAMYIFSVYRILFEYAGTIDYRRVALSLVASTLASVTAAAIIGIEAIVSPPVILLSFIFDMALVLAVRALFARQMAIRREEETPEGQSLRRKYIPQRKSVCRVMVIGSQRAAADLIAEMQENESAGRKPEIIIDDDKNHEGSALLGVEIVSGRSEIRLRARRLAIDEIIIAKPSAGKRQIAALLRECVKTRCRIRLLPLSRESGASVTAAPAEMKDLRDPTIYDLLGRDMPRTDHREIGDQLKGRVVLVTGGAGVFGSELCKRIIRYRPRRLIALDTDEDGLTMLAAWLEEFNTEETEFRSVIASVRDQAMMRRAFSAFRPHIVFHAAELKQIPFAQTNPRETFLTNVYGLKNVCDLADEYAAEKFILCSTVRAAAPANVAAECKRAAELYIEEKNAKSQTRYASVRFPNLIEGRGNVIAVFEKQLSQGGPLTLTDKDIMRRFISAEEAALLTARAAALAAGGEIFELGPGEAIGIRELAEAMIRLTGKIPYEEIDIIITQLRPGELLFEDNDTNGLRGEETPADRIRLTSDKSDFKLPHWSQLWVHEIDRIDDAFVMELLRLIFPTYKSKSGNKTMRGERIENE